MVKGHSANRLSSKELHNFKLQVFFTFVVCAFVLQLWFAFRGHNYLQDHDHWHDVVSAKTRVVRAERQLVERKPEEPIINKRIQYRKTKSKWISKNKGGRLLSMTWDQLCCQSINCLRKYPLFPLLPSNTRFLRSLRVSNSERLYGQRIMGRLLPPENGNYSFLVKCMALTCEMWLGENEFPMSSKLFMKVVHGSPVNVTEHQGGFKTELSSRKTYFIDVLFMVYREVDSPLEISWKLPNSGKFVVITQRFFARFPEKRGDSLGTILKVYSHSHAVRLTRFLESIEEEGEDDEDVKTIGEETEDTGAFFDHLGLAIPVNRSLQFTGGLTLTKSSTASLSLKSCAYKPSYLVNSSLPKYTGIWGTVISSVFPKDNTGHMMCIGNRYPLDCRGNDGISRTTIQKLLSLYTIALNEKKSRPTNRSGSELKVASLINIEEKKDPVKGSRFLLEAVVKNSKSNSTYFHSSYLHMNKHGTSLCIPSGFGVDMATTINVVVVVKTQLRWLRHFLANMEKIYVSTNEKHLNIIIANYGREDAKLMKEFKSNRLPNIRTVRHFGKFHKTKAIQSAVDTIHDPNSIIFLMDLHILVPETMMALIRKHTFQGKMVFNPVLFRLSHCGSPASYSKAPLGFWETFGYGILGIFKSDWDRIGGMSSKKYNHGWGGEDWELLDRILAAGLEVERLRVPNFYHFYHSKNNMWN